MSKRKNRSAAPNLPQEALERARRQAAIERGELPPEPEVPVVPEREPEAPRITPPVTPGENPYRTVSAAQRRAARAARTGRRTRSMQRVAPSERVEELDAETITELLENPTREVTEEQLRQEYGYVLKDMRSMFVLTGGLIVLLIALAFILPQGI